MIFLVERVVLQIVPHARVHPYFHGVYRAGVKQPVYVFGRNTGVCFVFIRRRRRMTGRGGDQTDGIQDCKQHGDNGSDMSLGEAAIFEYAFNLGARLVHDVMCEDETK